MKLFGKTVDTINWVYEKAGLIILLVMTVAMFSQVFTRYVLKSSLSGTEELSRYCFAWASLLGASLCVGKNSHSVISILTDMLKGRFKEIHSVFVQIMIMALGLVLLIYGIQVFWRTQQQVSAALRIPMSYIYLSVPVAGFGILINGIRNIVDVVARPGPSGNKTEASA